MKKLLSIASFFLILFAARAQTFPAGPNMDLRFHANLTDSSGNGNGALPETYGTGQNGVSLDAWRFSGTSCIGLTNTSIEHITTNDFAFSFWICITSPDFSVDPVPLSKGTFQGCGYYTQFIHNPSDGTKAQFQVSFNQTGARQVVTTTNIFTTNQWYNLVFTRSGSTGTIYVDGTNAT